MDFFERWFHISPDNGSGAYEAILIAVVLVVAVWLIGRALALSSLSGPERKQNRALGPTT